MRLTATIIVVHEGKALFHWHEKLQHWLPVGGGLEEEEAPHEAALREIAEEAGIEIEFWSDDHPAPSWAGIQQLPRPAAIVRVELPIFLALDFLYFARAKTVDLRPGDGQAREFRWLAESELDSLNIPVDLRYYTRRALSLLAAHG